MGAIIGPILDAAMSDNPTAYMQTDLGNGRARMFLFDCCGARNRFDTNGTSA